VDVALSECVMVGDRMSTDIRMALDTGMPAALVLTGETKAEDLKRLSASDTPDFVLDRVDRLLPLDTWNELDWKEEP
jgi:4-nitrophenyl phosphatase